MNESPLIFFLFLEHVRIVLFVGHIRRLFLLQLSFCRLRVLLLLHLLLVIFVILLILANDSFLLLDVRVLLLADPAPLLVIIVIIVPLKAVLHRVRSWLVRVKL